MINSASHVLFGSYINNHCDYEKTVDSVVDRWPAKLFIIKYAKTVGFSSDFGGDYANKLVENDIITVQLDMSNGTLRFGINDIDYGIAFKDIDTDHSYTLAIAMDRREQITYIETGQLENLLLGTEGDIVRKSIDYGKAFTTLFG